MESGVKQKADKWKEYSLIYLSFKTCYSDPEVDLFTRYRENPEQL
jgi:hypothetical protein